MRNLISKVSRSKRLLPVFAAVAVLMLGFAIPLFFVFKNTPPPETAINDVPVVSDQGSQSPTEPGAVLDRQPDAQIPSGAKPRLPEVLLLDRRQSKDSLSNIFSSPNLVARLEDSEEKGKARPDQPDEALKFRLMQMKD